MYVESYKEYKIHRMVVMKVGDFNKTDFVMMYVYKITDYRNLLNFFNFKNKIQLEAIVEKIQNDIHVLTSLPYIAKKNL